MAGKERDARPVIALTVGDPSGIGPEIIGPAVRAVEGRARIIALGPGCVRPDTIPLLDAHADGSQAGEAQNGGGSGWVDTGGAGAFELGCVSAASGDAAVRALRHGHGLALSGAADALVTGPVNKAALHAAGTRVEGQTELLSQWCGDERTEMVGFAGPLRVMLATRHMPLREALDRITTEHVLDRLVFFDEALRGLGFESPKIALAGLNPHAGEGGLLGAEDGEILAPAVEAARSRGLDVVGPISPDSVFADGFKGAYTGVLALYHDQAFIPLKLVAEGRGVTFIAGLSYPRFSPMHGTAFDIVGKRGPDGLPVADPTNLIEALEVALRVVGRKPE